MTASSGFVLTGSRIDARVFTDRRCATRLHALEMEMPAEPKSIRTMACHGTGARSGCVVDVDVEGHIRYLEMSDCISHHIQRYALTLI